MILLYVVVKLRIRNQNKLPELFMFTIFISLKIPNYILKSKNEV